MKVFNTTGTCFPDDHYMVDISKQVNYAEQMVRSNYYFCINQGRQYGKTTTLYALKNQLDSKGFSVFSLSFEGLGDTCFETLDKLCQRFSELMNETLMFNETKNISENEKTIISEMAKNKNLLSSDFSIYISKLCAINKNIIIIIDEVDQASNYESFIKFLGLLRDKYLNRKIRPTFQSVILAGVYDIKNLKLKIRPESEHQYNSPWNIAKPYSTQMGLPEDGIAKMLAEFKADYQLDFDENKVAKAIYDWTNGYPFLVSRICEFIQQNNFEWNEEGVSESVKEIINEPNNTLLDDLTKKLDDFPQLKDIFKEILFNGSRIAFNIREKYIHLAYMFGFVENKNGAVKIANRVFENTIYDLFISEESNNRIFTNGSTDKKQITKNDNLDLKLILERFAYHYNKIFNSNDEQFIETQARKLFLLYLRPIINGTGFYHIEAQTRDNTRTDIVIDYKHQQYVIELKIWHGEEYNRKGEVQLSEYLDYFDLKEGYMLSFCFNKSKQVGLQKQQFGEKVLWEVIV
ncbi:MAG: AAA-like domain-containing protein [Bacteroidales bacterium]|nr:AAA-like domain-containing protein [Bacteroidales bacterium]